MKQDRFLTGILIGIGVLIFVALAVFFTRNDTQTYVAEDTPEGVTHNYIVAVLNKNYQKAYTYLAELDNKPTYEQFLDAFIKGLINPEDAAADIGRSEIIGDTASVDVGIVYNPTDPFSMGYRDVLRAVLVLQDGAWKLSSMPAHYFWDHSWYAEQPK